MTQSTHNTGFTRVGFLENFVSQYTGKSIYRFLSYNCLSCKFGHKGYYLGKESMQAGENTQKKNDNILPTTSHCIQYCLYQPRRTFAARNLPSSSFSLPSNTVTTSHWQFPATTIQIYQSPFSRYKSRNQGFGKYVLFYILPLQELSCTQMAQGVRGVPQKKDSCIFCLMLTSKNTAIFFMATSFLSTVGPST